MKTYKLLVFCPLIFCFFSSIFAQTIDENSDIVGWSDLTFIIPLKKKEEKGKKVDQWTLNLGGVLRFGRNLKRPIEERGVTTVTYRINKYFTIGTGYLYRRFRLTEARRQYEHRLMFFLNSSKNWTNVQLRNRSMTTYLIKHSRPDTVVFRNRAQLNFPIMKDKKEVITPFVADEPFYDFREKKWFRNDFFAGISKQFTPKFGADFYYLHQNFNIGTLRQTNGFGVSFRFKLDFIK
jgi:hypothetical protein